MRRDLEILNNSISNASITVLMYFLLKDSKYPQDILSMSTEVQRKEKVIDDSIFRKSISKNEKVGRGLTITDLFEQSKEVVTVRHGRRTRTNG